MEERERQKSDSLNTGRETELKIEITDTELERQTKIQREGRRMKK